MKNLFERLSLEEDPSVYENKDSRLEKTLGIKEFLTLGVGTIISASILTLPGIIAARYAGPAIAILFLLAALAIGLVAFAYAEVSATMPFAGSAYSWINVIFGEFWGWVASWALLAKYFITVAFIASDLSSNLQGLLSPAGFSLPEQLRVALGIDGGLFGFFICGVILLVTILFSRGAKEAARAQNILVVLKVLAIIIFITVGITTLHPENYIPFIPAQKVDNDGTIFGGWIGIYERVSTIFLSYIGFDSIAASSTEAKNFQKTMPRGIMDSLSIAVVSFAGVGLVLVGMFPHSEYANSAEPVGWALRQSGHPIIAVAVQAIVVVGMFTALVRMMLAGSRLVHSFGRDGILPRWLGQPNKDKLPNHALIFLTVVSVVLGTLLPFSFSAWMVSAGTLIAFMFVTLGVYKLRKRGGKDIKGPDFEMPSYPVLPALVFPASLAVFLGLDTAAKLTTGAWFIIGLIIYLSYGIKHLSLAKSKDK